jgi:hypothetical protein
MSVQIFNQSGGAGGKLRAIVAGSAASLPATAKEGTIAVITTTPIGTVWAQADEPASPSAGDVWIVLFKTSNTPINLVKNGSLMLYPIRVEQYDGSSWVAREGYAMASGAWSTMVKYAYIMGNLCESVSGGWNLIVGSGTTLENTANGLVCTMTGGAGRQSGAQTVGLIDLTNYTTIQYIVTISTIVTAPIFGAASAAMSVNNLASSSHYSAYVQQTTTCTDAVLSVDVTSLSGNYYVGFGSAANMTVQKIWLE